MRAPAASNVSSWDAPTSTTVTFPSPSETSDCDGAARRMRRSATPPSVALVEMDHAGAVVGLGEAPPER